MTSRDSAAEKLQPAPAQETLGATHRGPARCGVEVGEQARGIPLTRTRIVSPILRVRRGGCFMALRTCRASLWAVASVERVR